MNTPAFRRVAAALILLTHIGRRRLGGLIVLVFVLLWAWSVIADLHVGSFGEHRMRVGPLTLTKTTYSSPR